MYKKHFPRIPLTHHSWVFYVNHPEPPPSLALTVTPITFNKTSVFRIMMSKYYLLCWKCFFLLNFIWLLSSYVTRPDLSSYPRWRKVWGIGIHRCLNLQSDLLLLSKTHCKEKHWKTSIKSVFHCPWQANSVLNGIYLEAFVLYLILHVEGSLLTPHLYRGYLGLIIDIKLKGQRLWYLSLPCSWGS